MGLPRVFRLLIMGLAGLAVAGLASAADIQRSTDAQGTIKIGNRGPDGGEQGLQSGHLPPRPAPEEPVTQAMPGSRTRQSVRQEKTERFGHVEPPAPPPGRHQTPTGLTPPPQAEEAPAPAGTPQAE